MNDYYTLLKEISVPRYNGSDEEHKASEIISQSIRSIGEVPQIEEFEIPISIEDNSSLIFNGEKIPVIAYDNCPETPTSGIKAPFFYLETISNCDLRELQGKIVLINGFMNKRMMSLLKENGALGFITYYGNAVNESNNLYRKALPPSVEPNNSLPGVIIKTVDAMKLALKAVGGSICLLVRHKHSRAISHNVSTELKGAEKSKIFLMAHYDSVWGSPGASDNAAGCIALLMVLDHYCKSRINQSLKFVWFGSEESELLGSKYYYDIHGLDDIKICINIDIIGAVLGKNKIIVSGDNELLDKITYLINLHKYPSTIVKDLQFSDSLIFVANGIAALNFCREARRNISFIHTENDSIDFISMKSIEETVKIIITCIDAISDGFACDMTVSSELCVKAKQILNGDIVFN